MRQWLTTNFLNPVFKTAKLFTKGRQFRADRSWRTGFFCHEQFSHETHTLVAAIQPMSNANAKLLNGIIHNWYLGNKFVAGV
jgi:hypothetical protein